MNLDWFYDTLDLGLKHACTKLLDSDWFDYNQAGMVLGKSENLLELSVKQLARQSRSTSLISLGQAMFSVGKNER